MIAVAGAAVVLAATSALFWVARSETPSLTFTWSMAPRFGVDANSDGLVDYPSEADLPDYTSPSAWKIELDACASAYVTANPDAVIHWRLNSKSGGEVDGHGCRTTLELPTLGAWTVRGSAAQSQGAAEETSVTGTIRPRDLLIVSVGDSVASGEGNPDRVVLPSTRDTAPYNPQWQNRQCHRSSLSGTAQAAKRLEDRDPHSAVTFVHLACSGATVASGLIGPYGGIDPSAGTTLAPQIEVAEQIASTRPIDALIVSVGANDVQFSEIVKRCLQQTECHADRPGSASSLFRERMATLPQQYDNLAQALSGIVSPRAVFLTNYFDPTWDSNGKFCGNVAEGIEQSEWSWASRTVLGGINGEVANAVGRHGWRLSGSHPKLFRGHGYCANGDRWIRTIAESLLYQRDADGPFHPNVEGHLHGYAVPLETVLAPSLGITAPPQPLPADPVVSGLASGLSGFLGALDALDTQELLDAAAPWIDGRAAMADLQSKGYAAVGRLRTFLTEKADTLSGKLTAFDAALDDLDGDGNPAVDATAPGGLVVDLSGSVEPHAPATAYDVDLMLQIRRPGVGQLDISDPAVTAQLPVTTASLVELHVRFRLDPTARGFSLDVVNPDRIGRAGISVEADYGSTNPHVGGDRAAVTGIPGGLVDLSATGSVSASVGAAIGLSDPNRDGRATLAELTQPADRFVTRCESGRAAVDVRFSAGISQLPGLMASATMTDDDLCVGSLPSVSVHGPALVTLRTLTLADIVTGLAQLTRKLQSLASLARFDTPFTDVDVTGGIDAGAQLAKFFVDNNLTSATTPLSTVNPSAKVPTFARLVELLLPALGLTTASIDNNRLVLPVDPPRTRLPTVEAALNVGQMFEKLGVVGLSGRGAAKARVDAHYDLSASIGVDLTPGLGMDERFFVGLRPGPEFEVDVRAEADIDLVGRIGPVEITLVDTNPTAPVTILRGKTKSSALGDRGVVSVDLNRGDGNRDNQLTLRELAQANSNTAAVTLDAFLPSTQLDAHITLGGQKLATGFVTAAWPDLRPGNGAPTITAGGSFATTALRFDVDHGDPRALVRRVIQYIRDTSATIAAMDAGALKQSLPFIGEGAGDAIHVMRVIRDTSETLLFVEANLTLDQAVQQLEHAVKQKLSGTNLAGLDDLIHLGYDSGAATRPPALTVALAFSVCTSSRITANACTVQLAPLRKPFSISLGGSSSDAPSLLGAGGKGAIDLDLELSGRIEGGLQLPAIDTTGAFPKPTGTVLPFLSDRSHLQMYVGASLGGSFEADLLLTQVTASPRGRIGVGFKVGRAAPTGQRLFPGTADFDAFFRDVVAAHPTQNCTLAGTTAPSVACAQIAIRRNSSLLGTVEFRAKDLLDPRQWEVNENGVTQQLASGLLDLDTLLNGLDVLLTSVENGLRSMPPGSRVPLLGGDASAGADVVNKLRTYLRDPLGAFIAQVTMRSSPPSAIDFESELEQRLTAMLGTGSDGRGPRLLRSPLDVRANCGGVCTHGHKVGEIRELELALPLGRTGELSTKAFDIGLPGLRLSSQGTTSIRGEWNFDLVFGVSNSDGFYVRSDNPLGTSTPELRIDTSIELPDELSAEFAFLPGRVRDRNQRNDAAASVRLDLTGGGPDHRLSTAQLLDPSSRIDWDLRLVAGMCANLDLGFEVGPRPGDKAAALPRFSGNLIAAAGVTKAVDGMAPPAGCGGAGIAGVTAPASPMVSFNSVSVNLGSFLSNFALPVARQISQVAAPIVPVIDAINAPIPGVAEAARLVGIPSPTWRTVLESRSGTNLAFLDNVRALVDVVARLEAATDGTISLGDFPVDASAALLPAADPATVVAATNRPSPLATRPEPVFGDLRRSALSFPAFESPDQLIQFLLGKDPVLLRWAPQPVRTSAELSYSIPIGPVALSVGGGFDVEGRIAAGLNSAGIRAAAKTGRADALLQGLFFEDLDGAGNDVPEIAITGRITAGAGILGASITGSIDATAFANLRADDGASGIVSWPEIERRLNTVSGSPLCLFDIGGRIGARLDAYALGFHKKIADTTIHSFDVDTGALCGPKSASQALSFDASGRLVIAGTEGPDVITVEGLGARAVLVRTPEHQRVFNDTRLRVIEIDGKGGNDTLGVVHSSVTGRYVPRFVQLRITGGAGDDIITGGDCRANVDCPASDVLDGGEGNDTIVGNAGDDTITGGPGNDRIDAHRPYPAVDSPGSLADNDRVQGGPGDDDIVGGDGDDTLFGDDGDDRLWGDRPDGTSLIHRTGRDRLDGGLGDDWLDGGSEIDLLEGGDGADLASYASSRYGVTHRVFADLTEGVAGIVVKEPKGRELRASDVMEVDEAGYGPHSRPLDTLVSIEDLEGSAEADRLIGAPAVNRLNGLGGDDDLDGRAGDDIIFGATGADTLTGGTGADQVHGGEDDDTLVDRGGAGDGGDTYDGGPHCTPSPTRPCARGDTMTYFANPEPTAVSLDGQANDGADGETDNVLGVEKVISSSRGGTVEGSAGPDDITVHSSGGIAYAFGRGGNDSIRIVGIPDAPQSIRNTTPEFGAIVLVHASGGDGDDLIDAVAGRHEGGEGNDTIRAGGIVDGGGGDDWITGAATDDTLMGGRGDDRLDGGTGADHLDGGDGDDTVQSGQTVKSGGSDVLRGGSGSDKLIAGRSAMTSTKGKPVPVMECSNRDVRARTAALLDGGPGNDVVCGGDGSDRLVLDAGEDVLHGGGGVDTLDASARHEDLRVTLDHGQRDDGSPEMDNGGDDVTAIEAVVLGSGDDHVVGGPGNETFDGGPGNDFLDGGGGANSFLAGPGADVMTATGDAPERLDDIVDYSRRIQPVTVSARAGAGDDGGVEDEVLDADGNAVRDTVDVGTVIGSASADRLSGPDRFVRLIGGAGADVFDGGAVVDYSAVPAPKGPPGALVPAPKKGVRVSIDGQADDGAGERDNVRTTAVRGTAGPDRLTGGDGDETLWGDAGNDVVQGGGGDDELFGEGGNDSLDGGAGADWLEGGAGSDEASYATRTTSVVVSINGGSRDDGGVGEGDEVRVENATGGSNNDILIGDEGANRLTGGEGNDTIHGLDGSDYLDGGRGDDTLDGGNGVDAWRDPAGRTTLRFADVTVLRDGLGLRVDLHGNFAGEIRPTVADDEPIEQWYLEPTTRESFADVVDVFAVTGSGSPDHLRASDDGVVLRGGMGADYLEGGDGDDHLDPGASALIDQGSATQRDRVRGGGGADTVAYAGQGGVCVDLASADGASAACASYPRIPIAGTAFGDRIERLIGSSGRDVLLGTTDGDVILGGDGDDRIIGRDGDDTEDGGDGDDFYDQEGRANGADRIHDSGAVGTDSVSYLARTSPVRVTKDNTANDGEEGEGDNINSSIEVVEYVAAANATVELGSAVVRKSGSPLAGSIGNNGAVSTSVDLVVAKLAHAATAAHSFEFRNPIVEGVDPSRCTVEASNLQCRGIELAPGETRTFTVTVGGSQGRHMVRASVEGQQAEQRMGDNVAEAAVDVAFEDVLEPDVGETVTVRVDIALGREAETPAPPTLQARVSRTTMERGEFELLTPDPAVVDRSAALEVSFTGTPDPEPDEYLLIELVDEDGAVVATAAFVVVDRPDEPQG